MENNLTIVPPELKGTVLVTGELGIGKTTFALTAELPERTAMVDLDEKGYGIAVEQMGIGEYFAPTTETSEPWKVYELFDAWLTDLPQDKFTTAVIDNISVFEDGLRQHIVRKASHYAEKFNIPEKNILSGSFGGANTPANKILSEIIARFRSKGVTLVIQTAHTGNKWVSSGIVPGKRTIKGLSRWDSLAILSLILVPPRADEVYTGAPAALVRKEQLASYNIVPVMNAEKAERMMHGEGGHIVKRRLPRRIYPCTWQTIKKYLVEPANFESPTSSEVPLPEEIQPYEERLRLDQLTYITASMELAAAELKKEQGMSESEMVEHDLRLASMINDLSDYEGEYTPVAIKNELQRIGHPDADIATAVQVINKLQENE